MKWVENKTCTSVVRVMNICWGYSVLINLCLYLWLLWQYMWRRTWSSTFPSFPLQGRRQRDPTEMSQRRSPLLGSWSSCSCQFHSMLWIIISIIIFLNYCVRSNFFEKSLKFVCFCFFFQKNMSQTVTKIAFFLLQYPNSGIKTAPKWVFIIA